jgi:hypothetical protein
MGFYYSANNTVALTESFIVFQVVRAFMLVVALLIAEIAARPDSAGIVHRVNGLAYGKSCCLIELQSCANITSSSVEKGFCNMRNYKVISVTPCRSRGPGSIPGATRFSEK